MKKIYTFTVEGEDYYSSKFKSDLRLIAYLLYDSIRNYDDYEVDNRMPLILNKNIVYNQIHEVRGNDKYLFDSDLYGGSEFIDYEPFIIGHNVFGFTVNDELISEKCIKKLVNYVLNLVNLHYEITVDSVSYQSKNAEDERYRWDAKKIVFEKLGLRCNKKVGLVRKLLVRSNMKNRRGYNAYGR